MKLTTGLAIELIEHTETVCDALYISEYECYVTASEDATVAIFFRQQDGRYTRHAAINTASKATALSFDNKRSNLLIGLDNGLMLIVTIDLETKSAKLAHQLDIHKDRINYITYNAEKDLIISVGKDKMVRLYNPAKKTIVGGRFKKSVLLDCAYDPRYDRVFCASYDKVVRIGRYAERTAQVVELEAMKGHKGSVRAVDYNAESQILFTGSFDRTAAMWDVSQVGAAVFIRSFAGHLGKVKGVAYTDLETDLLFTTGDDGFARAFVASTGECAKTWKVASAPVVGCRYYPETHILLTFGQDKVVRGWRVTTTLDVEPSMGEPVRTVDDLDYTGSAPVTAIPLGSHDLMDSDEEGL
ncbi:WD domain, G-beta repeat [Carpediemonas membranifera]|uniref:WD domain, G-beta repeat n=1 Tax=Carpediemonas membranifera TaxID=201153 RepID=A0A8J6DYP7_9EUKA|nr:WD domain, G-beta repeat [Carpediemonas membranifera]|eukprot:KAG9392574.1 WD domain, G-beta repeat [Carpediemonas membranifera]